MNDDVIIIVPALDPDERLAPYIGELSGKGFRRFLLVDDGSAEENKTYFALAAQTAESCGGEAKILTHEVNKGKGRALKDAFAACLTEKIRGVITVDADGQHTAADVARVAEAMRREPEALVLGTRDFTLKNVPWKSRFGNVLTSAVFRLFLGLRVSDTQTGLRGIPASCLRIFSTLYGERFEYETEMFVCVKRERIPICEVTIETVYENGNAGTHFHPIKDSVKIYRIILRSFFK